MAAVDDGSSPPVHGTFLLHLLPPVRLPALRSVGGYSSRRDVRCSSSVPCLFPGARREPSMYVDGGISSWIPRFLLPVRLEQHHTAAVDKQRGHCEGTTGVGRTSHAVCWE
ncbi:hypothetical protein BU14_0148s0007 [Porphyra umbilicalis]|uniref:Uncharacterized protein n=1 Tax=Porphyra umbilicalis TaxID=2786 RepID=A0A1X6P954_PORUM|nr:hypothetical protein BU14_0148s0007 [Porphyra umbilicalis]|eukprot:OSX77431.1 hypothetical protein BU14_0148s0007 [Porphyra umbilicalis]